MAFVGTLERRYETQDAKQDGNDKTRRKGVMYDTSLPGMGAMVLPCWICGALAQQIIHTPEGLKEFHRFGPLCDKCQTLVKRLEREHESLIDIIAKAVKQYTEPVLMHSGEESLWILDVLELGPHFFPLMVALHPQYQLVGIELGGALLARSHSIWSGIARKEVNGSHIYIPEPPPCGFPPGKISLVDDVVTTGKSLEVAERALNQAGYEVVERLCILDRRPQAARTLEVRSLVTAEDLGFSSSV